MKNPVLLAQCSALIRLSLAVFVAFAGSSQAVAQRTKVRRLTHIKVDARDYRLGFGLTGAIPEKAFKLKVGREVLLFWDLDGDGKLATGDGLSLDGLPFIVRLPEYLLLGAGQFRIAFPKELHVELTPDKLDLRKDLIKDCALLTRLRITHGKPPLRLDVPASKACELHGNYLRLHPPGVGSLSAHDEVATNKGYSKLGAAAGKKSCLYPDDDLPQAVEWCVATIWHTSPLMDPEVTSFGCAAVHGWTLLQPLGGRRRIPFVHPADGADGVAREFGFGGESPNPVPGTNYAQGCGHPVFARLKPGEKRLLRAALEDEDGNVVAGTLSCPMAPANATWPTNSGCAAFVPSKPLRAGTRYHVTFTFDGGRVLSWQFRTKSSKGRLARKKWRYTPGSPAPTSK